VGTEPAEQSAGTLCWSGSLLKEMPCIGARQLLRRFDQLAEFVRADTVQVALLQQVAKSHRVNYSPHEWEPLIDEKPL
jgi:hypothetical protein